MSVHHISPTGRSHKNPGSVRTLPPTLRFLLNQYIGLGAVCSKSLCSSWAKWAQNEAVCFQTRSKLFAYKIMKSEAICSFWFQFCPLLKSVVYLFIFYKKKSQIRLILNSYKISSCSFAAHAHPKRGKQIYLRVLFCLYVYSFLHSVTFY